MTHNPYLSIVIPALNEAERLPATLRALARYLTGHAYAVEVIVVDDGSTDGTAAIAAQQTSDALPIRLLENHDRRGKGASVQRGVRASRGQYVLFCDADGATDFHALDRCWSAFASGARVVIGSRRMPGACIVRAQPWMRRQMSAIFRWLANRVLLHPVSDIMCGFKCFDAAAARAMFTRTRLMDWAFDAELLYIAQYLRYTIAEVPVTWTDDARSRVHLSTDAWQALRALWRLRRHGRQHDYVMTTTTPFTGSAPATPPVAQAAART